LPCQVELPERHERPVTLDRRQERVTSWRWPVGPVQSTIRSRTRRARRPRGSVCIDPTTRPARDLYQALKAVHCDRAAYEGSDCAFETSTLTYHTDGPGLYRGIQPCHPLAGGTNDALLVERLRFD